MGAREQAGLCYLWHEGEMGRGSSDIATAVCRWLEAKDAEGMKEVIFYSDAPASQNRNKYFVSPVLRFLTRAQSITVIRHKVSTFQSPKPNSHTFPTHNPAILLCLQGVAIREHCDLLR